MSRLIEAGFDTAEPTVWLDGGVLDYLPRERVHTVFDEIHAASTAGSHFACVLPAPMPASMSAEIARVVGGVRDGHRPPTGFGPDLKGWLTTRGWRTSVHEHSRVAAEYGRPVPADVPGVGYLTAVLP